MSTSSQPGELEALLQRALAPVEPPEHLVARMEERLSTIHSLAADELDAWELDVLHDPRTWVRPVAAVAVGGRRGASRPPEADPVRFAIGALRTIADEVERRMRG